MEDKSIKALLEGFVAKAENLIAPEFTMNDVKFRVTKLAPLKGFDLFEEIRYQLARNADTDHGGKNSEKESAILFFKAVLTLNPVIIMDIRSILFVNVEFMGGESGVDKKYTKLVGLEEMAFSTLEAIHIYELLIRCLAVNFSASFRALASEFPYVETILNLLKR